MLKHTPDDSPDKVMLQQVVVIVREFLGRVNTESGRTENRFNLLQLDAQLVFKQGEQVVSKFEIADRCNAYVRGYLQNLRLKEEGREMVYKGALNKRDGELQVYLFDHALLFTKQVKAKQHEQLRVYRRVCALAMILSSFFAES